MQLVHEFQNLCNLYQYHNLEYLGYKHEFKTVIQNASMLHLDEFVYCNTARI